MKQIYSLNQLIVIEMEKLLNESKKRKNRRINHFQLARRIKSKENEKSNL